MIPGACYQLGFVTNDYNATKAVLMKAYGVSDFFMFENIEFLELKYTGKSVEGRVNVAIGYSGETQIEIVEPLGGNDLYAECLKDREFGLHHIGVLVDDIEDEIQRRKLGQDLVLQSGYVGQEKGIQFAFLDTRSELGILTELVWLSPQVKKTYERLRQRATRAFQSARVP